MALKVEVVSEEEILRMNVNTHQPRHQYRRGGVREMVANMRNMVQQNATIQQLLMKLHGQVGFRCPNRRHFNKKERKMTRGPTY